MTQTTDITPELETLMLISEALGYSKGRSSLREEVLNLIKDNYEDASNEVKIVYLAFSQLMLDSYNRDVADGKTQS